MADEHSNDPDLERRARLSVVWQELINPVRAILGYQEIIVDEARQLALDDCADDLQKVLDASQALNELVEGLRAPTAVPDEADGIADFQARLRHDLRTPLNAIIGYSEMVQETLEADPRAENLVSDIDRLLAEAKQLLQGIDAIVDFRRTEEGASGELHAGTHAVVTGLLKSLRPRKQENTQREVGRILAVDDNKSNLGLLERRLKHEGHEVTLASSGKEALAELEQQAFDLILLDLLMPDMNGIEVLEVLKADERWQQIPVIMISGLQERDAAIRCIEAGAEDYLTKPFSPVLLRARINACLERRRWREREREYLDQLREEKERSEALIRTILPEPIVLRLNDGETIIADRFETASILFADMVGFTPTAADMQPARLVDRLDRVFSEFDALALSLGVEKIKTIGDAYMAAAGIPEPRHDHAEAMVEFARGILGVANTFNGEGEPALQIRIGIHLGPVVAGIIGRHKFIYDVWGDTVNIASRLEAHGIPNRIQVSKSVQEALADRYEFERRGTVALKGRGRVQTFLVDF